MTRLSKTSRLLGAGFAAGLIVGTAGVSTAALVKKGWERMSLDFRQGYVQGFIDATRIAKTYDPAGYLARQYRIPPKAGAVYWVKAIDDLYAKPEHRERTVWQLMAIAGPILEKQFGPESGASPGPGQLAALRDVLERAEAKENEKAAHAPTQQLAAGQQPNSAAPGHADGASAAGAGAGEVAASTRGPASGGDAPGVKQRRRQCARQCKAKAEAERAAYHAARAGQAASAPARAAAPGGSTPASSK